MSETYRALTRKYRPRSFDDVVSQEHIINTLRNAIEQNRISHAYLFCGPRGVGKTTMARVVARMINGVGLDVDGEALGRTLDIIEIDAASNSGVDDVRSLRDGVRVPPQSGKYKVYIIDEVHMLSKQAFNALLKTLEEPPEHVKFIFATTEPHKVLPTVLSRVQRFDFRRIKVSEMVDRLRFICNEEKIKIDDESLHLIGRKADGALRDALSILDQVIAFCGDDIKFDAVLNALNAISNDKLFELIECSVTRDASKGMHIVHDLLLQGHDIQEFLVSITEHVRNMYFSRFATTDGTLLEVTEDEKARLKKSTKQFTEQDLLRMMHLTSEAQVKIRDSQQPRVLLEITILKLIMMDRAEGLNELLAELRELKKKTDLVTDQPASEIKGIEVESSDKLVKKGTQESETAKKSVEKNPKTVKQANTPVKLVSHETEITKKTVDKPAAEKKPAVKDILFGKPAIKKSGAKNGSHVGQSGQIDQAGSGNQGGQRAQGGQSGQIEHVGSDSHSGQSRHPAQSEQNQKKSTAHSQTSDHTNTTQNGQNNHAQTSINGNRTSEPVGDFKTEFESKESGNNQSKVDPNFIPRELIESNYQRWIDEVRKVCPQFVAISLIKTRLIETGVDFVVIECQDKLVEQLIDEHNENLTACLTKVIKRNVLIKTKVLITESTPSGNDPFASLKMLQEANPVVKTIVDVLGAELEY